MISTKGRYAIRVLINLAQNENENGDYIPLKEIAVRPCPCGQSLTIWFTTSSMVKS